MLNEGPWNLKAEEKAPVLSENGSQHHENMSNGLKRKSVDPSQDAPRKAQKSVEISIARNTPKRKSVHEKIASTMHDYPEYGDAKELALWLAWKMDEARKMRGERNSGRTGSPRIPSKSNRRLKPQLLKKLEMDAAMNPLFSDTFYNDHLMNKNIGAPRDDLMSQTICRILAALGTQDTTHEAQQNADRLLQALEHDDLGPVIESIEFLSEHELIQDGILKLLGKVEMANADMTDDLRVDHQEATPVNEGRTIRKAFPQSRHKSAPPIGMDSNSPSVLDKKYATPATTRANKRKHVEPMNGTLQQHDKEKQSNTKTRRTRSPVSRRKSVTTETVKAAPQEPKPDLNKHETVDEADASLAPVLSQSSSSSDTIMVAPQIDYTPHPAKVLSNSPTLTSTSTVAIPSSVTSFESLASKSQGTPSKRRDSLVDLAPESEKKEDPVAQVTSQSRPTTPVRDPAPDDDRTLRSSKRVRKPTDKLLEAADTDPTSLKLGSRNASPKRAISKGSRSEPPRPSLIVKLRYKVHGHSSQYLELAPAERSLVDRLLDLCGQAMEDDSDDDDDDTTLLQ